MIQRDGRYLAIRRAAGVRVPNTWCFPGGEIEDGETQEEALVREMQEELGVRCRPVEPCWDWTREDGKLRLRRVFPSLARHRTGKHILS